MFFTSDPRKWFPQTQIDVVLMPEGPGGNTLIEKTFSGPISSMLRDALAYLRNQFVNEYVRKHPDREEAERYFNLPYAALEEAIANAVYHRSYEEREPIEVRITPDEVTILSFPGPDRSIDMEALRAGRVVARRYRNRRIGEFLKELDLTEGRSTGIPKILQAMTANGSETPTFETDPGRTFFLVRLPVRIKPEEEGTKSAPSWDQVGTKSTSQNAEAHDEAHEAYDLTDMEETLLRSALNTPQGSKELLKTAGYKNRTGNFQRSIEKLLKTGLLAMSLPDKPRSKNQKYYITEHGCRALKL